MALLPAAGDQHRHEDCDDDQNHAPANAGGIQELAH
jgi:hypothetical protein